MNLFSSFTFLVATAASVAAKAGNLTLTKLVSVPSQDTFRILPSFSGNLSEGYVDTQTSNVTIRSLLADAKDAAFISYNDAEFLDIFGENPEAVLIQQRKTGFAYEAAVWVYDRNEVWFTSAVEEATAKQGTKIFRYNLSNDSISRVKPSMAVVNPNGGYYFDGLVYLTTGGDNNTSPSIVTIDPITYETNVVVNSYMGLAFSLLDDIAILPANHDGNGVLATHIYFTSVNGGSYTNRTQYQTPNAVWRFTPSTQALVPVISRADIPGPNGIRINANGTKLYVGEFDLTAPASSSSFSAPEVGAANLPGSPAIFEFDIDPRGFPINKRLFGIAREGGPDGLHIDDYGRVWTGEGEGVVVRNSDGKIIGILNAKVFLAPGEEYAIAQFALAGDVLVVLAVNRVWRIQLNQEVVRPGSFGN